MSRTTKQNLDRRATWPRELNEDEETAIREGLAELDRGEWVTEEEMKPFWSRCGVK